MRHALGARQLSARLLAAGPQPTGPLCGRLVSFGNVSAEDKAPDTMGGFDRDSQVRSRTGLGLRVGNRIVPLSKEEIVLGRAGECDVILDGPLVSRRHAKITITEDKITIEDLGSRNGIQVDGVATHKQVEIRRGTKIQLGDERMEVVELDAEMKRRVTATDFRAAHTVRFERPSTQPDQLGPDRVSSEDMAENTLRAQSFELLSGVVDKALAMGKGAEAERVLGGMLADALRDAQAKGKLAEGMAEKAAGYAVKLAQATGKATWIDYVFRLYKALGTPTPLAIVDEMYTVLRKVRGVNRTLLDDYVAMLKSKNLGPAGRFAIQRIEGLCRLASL